MNTVSLPSLLLSSSSSAREQMSPAAGTDRFILSSSGSLVQRCCDVGNTPRTCQWNTWCFVYAHIVCSNSISAATSLHNHDLVH